MAPKPPGNFKPPLSLSGISFFFVILDVSSDDKLLPISFLLLQLSSRNSTIKKDINFSLIYYHLKLIVISVGYSHDVNILKYFEMFLDCNYEFLYLPTFICDINT